MDDTPLWAILLIGLGSGALGAFATTWYRARHERLEAERDRKTEACYDFLRAHQMVMGAARDVLEWLRMQSIIQMPAERLEPVVAAGDAMLGSHSRLVLLFGPQSVICQVTEQVVKAQIGFVTALRAMPPDFGVAHENLLKMGDLLDEQFLATAHTSVAEKRRL